MWSTNLAENQAGPCLHYAALTILYMDNEFRVTLVYWIYEECGMIADMSSALRAALQYGMILT